VAAGSIHDMGFDLVDAGPLQIARYTEPFATLIAQLAYKMDGGPELSCRFEPFGKQTCRRATLPLVTDARRESGHETYRQLARLAPTGGRLDIRASRGAHRASARHTAFSGSSTASVA
jgi:hypothetical protein